MTMSSHRLLTYLPSKRFIVLLSILVVGIIAFYAIKGGKNGGKNFVFEKSSVSELFKDSNNKDSDNDGLLDWEEALWKTDANNKDTDGDGTSDGEEVNTNRDPLRPGPDDKMETAKMFSSDYSNDYSDLVSKTDSLTKSFLENFFVLYQSKNLNDDTRKALSDSFLSSLSQESLKDKYSSSDLNIIKDSSVKALKDYGNNVFMILAQETGSSANEIEIIKQAMQLEGKEKLMEVNPVITAYKNTVARLLALRVPQSLKDKHLVLINSINNLAISLENIKTIFDDSLKGLVGMSQYEKEYQRSRDALLDIYNKTK